MTKTLQLPCTWQNYMEQNYEYAFSNESVRVGWYYSTYNSEWRKYTGAIKIDTSQLTGISQYRVRDPRLVMHKFSSISTSSVTIRVRNLLKNAAHGMHWTKYDGANYWTSPGGESAGNDYSTTVISDLLVALNAPTEVVFPISVSSLFSIAANNDRLILFPPVTHPDQGAYIRFDRALSQTYIEFELLSNLTGDATMF